MSIVICCVFLLLLHNYLFLIDITISLVIMVGGLFKLVV